MHAMLSWLPLVTLFVVTPPHTVPEERHPIEEDTEYPLIALENKDYEGGVLCGKYLALVPVEEWTSSEDKTKRVVYLFENGEHRFKLYAPHSIIKVAIDRSKKIPTTQITFPSEVSPSEVIFRMSKRHYRAAKNCLPR